MKEIICFLNRNSGALSVIVTTVYTIATIAILIANFRSAKAANQQISVSHEQYRDSRHLQIMPFLQIGFSSVRAPEYLIVFSLSNNTKTTKRLEVYMENVGNGAAINISYSWKYGSINEQRDMRMAVIKPGETCKLDIAIVGELEEGKNNGVMTLKYSDLLGKYYTQDVAFCLKLDNQSSDDVKIQTLIPVPVESSKKEA